MVNCKGNINQWYIYQSLNFFVLPESNIYYRNIRFSKFLNIHSALDISLCILFTNRFFLIVNLWWQWFLAMYISFFGLLDCLNANSNSLLLDSSNETLLNVANGKSIFFGSSFYSHNHFQVGWTNSSKLEAGNLGKCVSNSGGFIRISQECNISTHAYSNVTNLWHHLRMQRDVLHVTL